MRAALLPERGVIKLVGDDARGFLNGLVTADMTKVAPGQPRFAALLTPQGKIVADFIVVEAPPEDGGAFLLDCPRALAPELAQKLNFYKLRAKIAVEDVSAALGVMAVWDVPGSISSEYGLAYLDPRLPALGMRVILPPNLAKEQTADLGAELVDADEYENHRIVLGIPRGGTDFIYGGAYPHETNMDQLGGVDFDKGCYVGQEVVSRVEHRSTARSRIVPIAYDEFSPSPGIPVTAGGKPMGTLCATARAAKRGIALLRLDRVGEAVAAGQKLEAGGIEIRALKPDWASFDVPGAAA